MYSNAVSFTYNNKSLSDFSHKMVIGYLDKSEDSFGLDREIVSGSTTMNRNIYHAYNTKYSGKLGFQITLFMRIRNDLLRMKYLKLLDG